MIVSSSDDFSWTEESRNVVGPLHIQKLRVKSLVRLQVFPSHRPRILCLGSKSKTQTGKAEGRVDTGIPSVSYMDMYHDLTGRSRRGNQERGIRFDLRVKGEKTQIGRRSQQPRNS